MTINHPMHLFSAEVLGDIQNTIYPTLRSITDEESLKQAVCHDYVCARYKNNHRSSEDFMVSDCLGMDIDNDHSENPADWVTPQTLQSLMPGVEFAVHYSRNHMKEKSGKPARPKFHVLFPTDEVKDAAAYTSLKHQTAEYFPFFDPRALDAGRCFYGTAEAVVELYPGEKEITELLRELTAAALTGLNPSPSRPADAGVPSASYALAPLTEGSRNTTLHHKAVSLLKRLGDCEEAVNGFREAASRCTPPLGEEELKGIWKSAQKYYKVTISAAPDYVAPEEYGKPKFEEPIPFDRWCPPPFPVDALPPVIADEVNAVAESTQTPVDMSACCALAMLATCMQGKFCIQGKPDWTEPVNLYLLVIMPPSERKSAVERKLTHPLDVYEKEYNDAHQTDVLASDSRERVLLKKQKNMEEQLAKGTVDENEMQTLNEELAAFHPVKPLRLYSDDVTTEKLVSIMADNDGRAAILSAEGGIFDILSGAYSGKVNIDAFLKGYSGDSIRVDRISRAGESIPHPVLTLLLMAQPNVLEGVMQNHTFSGRGLTARFLYSMPTSHVGSRKFNSMPVPPETQAAYEARIRNLLEDPYTELPELIELSPAATELLAQAYEEHEAQSKNDDAFDAWSGKIMGNILRIAALLCRASVERGHGSFDINDPLVVNEETMRNAIRIGDYFMAHAQGAFNLMGTDETVNESKYILSALVKNDVREFDRRKVMQLCHKFKKSADIQPGLDLLEDHRYISALPVERSNRAGRPALPQYVCNPLIFDLAG